MSYFAINYFFRSVALVHNNRKRYCLLSWRELTHNQNPLHQPFFLGPRFRNITTMDPVDHVLYRHPWLDDACFGATHVFPASSWTTTVLGLFYFHWRGEIYHTILPGDFGDFCHHSARNSNIAIHSHPGLDDACFRATRAFPASWWTTALLGLF